MTDINLEKEIENYQNAKKFIGEYFGMCMWYDIVFLLDEKWSDRYSDIRWGCCEDPEDPDDLRKSAEICEASIKDDYAMFVAENNGNLNIYLFRTENRLEP